MEPKNIIAVMIFSVIITTNLSAGKCCQGKQQKSTVQKIKDKISNIINRTDAHERKSCPAECVCSDESCSECTCTMEKPEIRISEIESRENQDNKEEQNIEKQDSAIQKVQDILSVENREEDRPETTVEINPQEKSEGARAEIKEASEVINEGSEKIDNTATS